MSISDDGRREPVWVAKAGWTPRALAVIEEIKRAGDWGLEPSTFKISTLNVDPAGGPRLVEKALVDAEFGLSLAVLKYARYARGGRIEDPATQLSSYLDRKPTVRRPWRVMAEIARADSPDVYLRRVNPQQEQFERLRQLYLARRDAGASGRVEIPEEGRKLTPGQSHQDVVLIRQRLGVPAGDGEKTVYDDALAEAVKSFQRKKGISPANGVINAKTRRAFNEGRQVTASTLLANMEEWRWMPENLGEAYVWANVPEFLVRVVKDGAVLHTERMIAGETKMQTPIFSANLQTIYFHPRWYVPESIKVKEIAPRLARGASYFRRQGMQVMRNGHEVKPETVNWSNADIREYDVIQPSGPDNALGVLKFTFPNKHMVYMHDTQNKDLFDADQRTFSHGCIRVKNPLRLGEVLLSIDKGWDAARVADLLKGEPRENGVALDKQIPVHVTYFTAQVDADGEVTTENDVYGHEKRITLR